jgi:hypothetical protein
MGRLAAMRAESGRVFVEALRWCVVGAGDAEVDSVVPVVPAEKLAKPFSAASSEKVRAKFTSTSAFAPLHSTTLGKGADMGNAKKEVSRKERQGKTGDGMGNVKTKGENFYRYDSAHALLIGAG